VSFFNLISNFSLPLAFCTFHWNEGIPASTSYCGRASTVLWPTPWRRVLREKLFVSEVIKFPAFYGIWSFISVCLWVHNYTLSWNRCRQSAPQTLQSFFERSFLGLSHVHLVVLGDLLLHFPNPVIKLPNRLM